MENSESQTKGSEESLNRLDQVEERISGLKDQVANWITQSNKMLNLNKYTKPGMENPEILGLYKKTTPINV